MVPVLLFLAIVVIQIIVGILAYSMYKRVSGDPRRTNLFYGLHLLGNGVALLHPLFPELICQAIDMTSKESTLFILLAGIGGLIDLTTGIGIIVNTIYSTIVLYATHDPKEIESMDRSEESIEGAFVRWARRTDSDDTMDEPDLICCPHCGSKQSADTLFCSACGTGIVHKK